MWWGYEVRVIRQRGLLSLASARWFTAIAESTGTRVGTVWKGKLGSKSNQFETAKKKAHNCK